MDEHLRTNRANWDERAPAHAASPGYDIERLLADPTALSGVVSFDLPLLGRLDGLDVCHLQCHIGTDTLSLARLGASSVAGLDFSPASLAQARDLAARAGVPIDYVESDVQQAATALGHSRFDVVYTGVGALLWIPSIETWARQVAAILRPGGRLFVREGHPMMWAIAETHEPGDPLVVGHPYFATGEPIRWEEPGTYVETDREFAETVTYEWSHGLGEIVQALLDAGLTITGLVEHEVVDWEALPGVLEPTGTGQWRLREGRERLPLTYTLQAVRPG
ncbi:MAG TPA: class I SAM-dependent methyltransferase [Dermatophilaceae bacterium]|nr:class I SAM-dependent methyltransferase [Dermatophilaceae bacterium]